MLELEPAARSLRQVGRANSEGLERLKVFADNQPPIEPEAGVFKGHQIPVRLSRVRLLDILLWTEVRYMGALRIPCGAPRTGRPSAPSRPSEDVVAVGTHTVTTPRTAETVLPTVNGVDVFKVDDIGYTDWLSRHPQGMVLTCERSPRASYLVLHRPTCSTISGTPARGRVWTGLYLKGASHEPG